MRQFSAQSGSDGASKASAMPMSMKQFMAQSGPASASERAPLRGAAVQPSPHHQADRGSKRGRRELPSIREEVQKMTMREFLGQSDSDNEDKVDARRFVRGRTESLEVNA